MKRGADAMDAGSERSNRGWRHPPNDNKRMRRDDARDAPVAGDATVKTLADEKETDPHRLAQRQKQIDYGKNTIGYDHYCALVPRHQRRPGKHPMTPDKTKKIGKKVFDGIVRKWRQALHKYDPPELTEAIKTVDAESAAHVVAPADTTASEGGATRLDGNVSSLKDSVGSTGTAASGFAPIGQEILVSPTAVAPSAQTPPSRSIYENFDEDNFEEEDSDDDLL